MQGYADFANFQSLVPFQFTVPIILGIAAGLIVLGAVLLLWGRLVHRIFLALVGAGLGFLLAGWVSARFHLDLVIARVVCIVVLATAGVLLARVWWALAGAKVFASAGFGVMFYRFLATIPQAEWPVLPEPTTAATQPCDLCAQYSTFFQTWFDKAWNSQGALLIVVPCVAALVPLIVGLIRPRLMAIFMTSLLGGAWLVAGLNAIMLQVKPSLKDTGMIYWYVLSGLVGALLILGMVYQYHGALASARARKKEQEGKPPVDGTAPRPSSPPAGMPR